MLLNIFPDLVLGNLLTTIAFLKEATGPISFLTILIISLIIISLEVLVPELITNTKDDDVNYLNRVYEVGVPRYATEWIAKYRNNIMKSNSFTYGENNRINVVLFMSHPQYNVQIDALMDTIKENAQALDDALVHIKVCDPAIGSGAFPVGMLNEIVKARKVLELYLEKEETTYTLKRHCIQESIYGVDIDPGAIDIAKLRLWLSLVVDEEDYNNIQTPQCPM